MDTQYLNIEGLTIYDALIKTFINSKIFIGTYAEYEAANTDGEIPVGALVIITDDETSGSGGSSGDSSSTSTSSLLGTGVLGYMVLG